MTKPTRSQVAEAARSFMRHREKLGPDQSQADLLMDLGRLYEFPPGTPTFTGPLTARAIAEFIQAHAVEIE